MLKMRLLLQTGLAALILTLPARSWAGADQTAKMMSMIQEMQQQMAEMQKIIALQGEKLRDIEGRQVQAVIAGPGTSAAGTSASEVMSDQEFSRRMNQELGGASSWLKDLKMKSDLRLRYDATQNTSGNPAENDDRNRFRLRLRLGFDKKFSDDMKMGFSLASGENSNGTNIEPTSNNQTLDNLFNFKDIWIEKAFATYTPNWAKKGPVENFETTAGKFSNPFEQGSTDMIWDRDVKPEGIYEKFDFKLIDASRMVLGSHLTLGQFVLDEDALTGGDANLFAHQLGLKALLKTPWMEEPLGWYSALSYYFYPNYARKNNWQIGSVSLARANSNVIGNATELDTGDFKVLESYNEIAICPRGVPVRFFTDWAQNLEFASPAGTVGTDEENAWSLGTRLGEVKKKGDWEISYAYKWIAANSIVSAFTDTEFGNTALGGKRGSVLRTGYALTDYLSINGGLWLVDNINADTDGVLDEKQQRFQVDLNWKFS